MWNNLLLKLEFARGGVVAGECPIVGYEGLIECDKVEFTISTASNESLQEKLDEKMEEESVATRMKRARQLLEARLKGAHKSVTRASVGKLDVTKRFDSASTAILKALSTQDECIAEFVALRRSTLGVKLKPVPWLKLSLSGASIEGADLKLAKGEKGMRVDEDLVFYFEKIEIEYMPPRSPGTTRFSYTRPQY
jgi:type VI protein secretion system component Hcp